MHIIVDSTNYRSLLNLTLVSGEFAAQITHECNLGGLPDSALGRALARVSNFGRYLFVLRYGDLIDLEYEMFGGSCSIYNATPSLIRYKYIDDAFDTLIPHARVFKLRLGLKTPSVNTECVDDLNKLRDIVAAIVVHPLDNGFAPVLVDYYYKLCEYISHMNAEFELHFALNANLSIDAYVECVRHKLGEAFIAWYSENNRIDV